jgi:outer membrane biosynthesis protein TonB
MIPGISGQERAFAGLGLGSGRFPVRTALIISALAHALFWGLATLWAPNPLAKPSETPPIMVELVSPAEADEANAKNTPEKNAPAEKNAAADQTAATDQKPEPQPAQPPDRPDQAPAAQAKSPASKSSAPKSSAPKSSAPKSSESKSPTPPAPTPPKLQQFAAGGWLDTALSLPPSTTSPFDVAESGANLERSEIAAFKAHLQECWKPPASLAAANNLVVVLRISLQPNGALSGEPTLLAASASEAGPTLIQTATRALQQCQPYAFLPADKYSEWRSLDLSFSPAGLRTIPTL